MQNALAFNRDMCCHLALCLQLLPFNSLRIGQPLKGTLLALLGNI